MHRKWSMEAAAEAVTATEAATQNSLALALNSRGTTGTGPIIFEL